MTEIRPRLHMEILEEMDRILEPEDSWIQNHGAIDGKGELIDPKNDAAVAFCIYGAMERAFYNLDCFRTMNLSDHVKIQHDIEALLCPEGPKEIGSLVGWNDADGRTHDEVRSRIRSAIKG